MNEQQTKLLNKIMSDKYSVGSFCGMIFNACINERNLNKNAIKELIILALDIRLIANKMLKRGENNGSTTN